jgi:hypothetical protein
MKALNLAQAATERASARDSTVLPREPAVVSEATLTDSGFGQFNGELLDPVSWGEVLSRFGRTMRMAVALADIDGNLLGPCHNPQPVWSLAMNGKAESGPACPFCLAAPSPCNALAQALATGELVYAADLVGSISPGVLCSFLISPIRFAIASRVAKVKN